MEERRNLHVRISDDAYERWRRFSREYGVTIGATIQAIGERLGTDRPLRDEGVAIVVRAREIDQRHRSRRNEG